MLIGFIVVIVMILVIVGLMATGNTGGGTGINQTKATKVVTEIGTIAQSLSFFKTTTPAGDMSGFTHADGISLLDGYDATGTSTAADLLYTVDDTAAGATPDGYLSADRTDLVKSQADPNVLYAFEEGSVDTNGTINAASTNNFVIDVVMAPGIDGALADTIGDTIKSKLNGGNMEAYGFGPTTDVNDPFTANSVLRVVVQ